MPSPLSPMVADWLALGQMYGDLGGFEGNTVWGFNTNIRSTVFADLARHADEMGFTVIDGGGRDTLDFSGQQQRINLQSGRDLLGRRARWQHVDRARHGDRGGAGGSGADVLSGNAAANTLSGLGGAGSSGGKTPAMTSSSAARGRIR